MNLYIILSLYILYTLKQQDKKLLTTNQAITCKMKPSQVQGSTPKGLSAHVGRERKEAA